MKPCAALLSARRVRAATSGAPLRVCVLRCSARAPKKKKKKKKKKGGDNLGVVMMNGMASIMFDFARTLLRDHHRGDDGGSSIRRFCGSTAHQNDSNAGRRRCARASEIVVAWWGHNDVGTACGICGGFASSPSIGINI